MGETTQPALSAVLSEQEAEDGLVEESEEEESEEEYGSAEHLAEGSKQQRASGKRHHADSTSSSAGGGVPSSPIPSFTSSSEPSYSPPSLSPRDSLSAGPPRRRRRKISDLGASEIWECPLYLCHKRYKKTSIQSIALHKAKCGSRPQLQQLISQQEEQLNKDRLLQQQSRQLHEQQLMLNRQQEEQQRQLMALDNARQALMLMQQQQQHTQQQQQQQQQHILQRHSAAAGPFVNQQQPYGLLPAHSPFTSMPSPSNQLSGQQLPLQHFSLTQTLSYPLSTGAAVEAPSPSSSSLVSTLSPVTQSSGAQPMHSPTLTPSSVPGAPRPPSAQQPTGMELLYAPTFATSAFMHHSQLQQPQQPQHTQHQQQHPQQQISPPWPAAFPMSGAGSLMSLPAVNSASVTMSASQPMPIGPYGQLLSMVPINSPLAVHFAAQQQQQQQQAAQQQGPLSTLPSPNVVTSQPMPVHQPLALQQQQQHSLSLSSQPHWLAGAPQPLSSNHPIHFVSTQATSMFVTSSSLSSSAASGALPLSAGPSSRPPSQSPASLLFASPSAALSPDRSGTAPPLALSSHMSPLSSLQSLHSPASAAATASSTASSAFNPTFTR